MIQDEYGKEQVYFEDEMCYGTRTECKKRWTRQGKRPTCKVKIGYEYGWLYVAICLQTGDMIACFINNPSCVVKKCNLFKIVLILDIQPSKITYL